MLNILLYLRTVSHFHMWLIPSKASQYQKITKNVTKQSLLLVKKSGCSCLICTCLRVETKFKYVCVFVFTHEMKIANSLSFYLVNNPMTLLTNQQNNILWSLIVWLCLRWCNSADVAFHLKNYMCYISYTLFIILFQWHDCEV